jgi:hypothetical protein
MLGGRHRDVLEAMLLAGFGKAFVAVERQVRNDAGGNTRVLAHLHKVFDAGGKGERAVGHDVDRRFGVAFVNFLHDFKALLGGKPFSSATVDAVWMAGPSALGSLKASWISRMFAPPFTRASAMAIEVSASGNPAMR